MSACVSMAMKTYRGHNMSSEIHYLVTVSLNTTYDADDDHTAALEFVVIILCSLVSCGCE